MPPFCKHVFCSLMKFMFIILMDDIDALQKILCSTNERGISKGKESFLR